MNQRGLTMIELMIALVIGAVLLIGAVSVYSSSRATYRLNESMARLQENARFALTHMEPDLRLANYWGLTNRADIIERRRGQADQLAAIATDCADRWYINVDSPVEGANGTNAPFAGGIDAGNYQAGSDVLVVRHASADPVTVLDTNRVHLQSDRTRGALFLGDLIPAGFAPPPASVTHTMIANAYYVAPTSPTLGNVPSLRRRTLVRGPAIRDEEVIPGVEDLQVQFGIDLDAEGTPGRGAVDRYVNADNPLLDPAAPGFDPDTRIVAVRLWLRLRTETVEQGHTDTSGYQYADQIIAPPNDGYRRIVVSKTIQLRNLRG